MLRSYEAVYTGNQFRWIGQAPPNQEMRVLVVANVVETKAKADDDIDEILDRAWGCLGTGKSLNEIDQEICVKNGRGSNDKATRV
jgi:hypothetical protein